MSPPAYVRQSCYQKEAGVAPQEFDIFNWLHALRKALTLEELDRTAKRGYDAVLAEQCRKQDAGEVDALAWSMETSNRIKDVYDTCTERLKRGAGAAREAEEAKTEAVAKEVAKILDILHNNAPLNKSTTTNHVSANTRRLRLCVTCKSKHIEGVEGNIHFRRDFPQGGQWVCATCYVEHDRGQPPTKPTGGLSEMAATLAAQVERLSNGTSNDDAQ